VSAPRKDKDCHKKNSIKRGWKNDWRNTTKIRKIKGSRRNLTLLKKRTIKYGGGGC